MIRSLALFSLATAALGCTATTGKPMKLENDKQKTGYAIGHQIGSDFKTRGIEVDYEALTFGIKEGLAGTKSQISQEDSAKLFQNLQTSMREKAQADQAEKGKKNQEEGKKFLEANKGKEGVKVLPSGLQYKVLTEGKGDKPKADDMVTTHYRGTLIDGTEFDSSHKRGEPASFPVGGVIKGWTEALQLMPVGSKWQLFVPSELAYGERGAGPQIGPHATLIFEVELISIGTPTPAPAAAPATTPAPTPAKK